MGLGEGVAAEAALPFGLLSQALGGLEGFDELGALEGLASADARAAFYYRAAAGWKGRWRSTRYWCCSMTCIGRTLTRSVCSAFSVGAWLGGD